MGITEQTRGESHEAVKPSKAKRRALILEVLKDKEMTATEIAEVLYEKGHTPYYERNYAAPRLTELKDEGLVETVGKKLCARTGRNIAVWRTVNQ